MPSCSANDIQVEKLSQLRASLELDGFQCSEDRTLDVPLVVSLNGHSVALGSYPGLIDRPEFEHGVCNCKKVDDHLALNEYLLRSNLPQAHLKVRKLLR